MRLLGSLPGARTVEDRGRVGVHHQFDVVCDEDLREDVGALAQTRGWALRELSWRRPTLEELFARIALGTHETLDRTDARGAALPAALAAPARAPVSVESSASLPLAPAAPDVARKTVYNLNPFDMGATRDLGRPKDVQTSSPSGGPQSDTAGHSTAGDSSESAPGAHARAAMEKRGAEDSRGGATSGEPPPSACDTR
jgi:hypothetical protein